MAGQEHISTKMQDASHGVSAAHLGRIYPDHMPVYHQGDAVTGFYQVKSGVVMVYRLHENSQRQISGFYTQGDFFGLNAGDTHLDSAVTVTTANVSFLTLADVERSPELLQELFSATCRQLEATQALIMTLTRNSSSEKIAMFLVMLAQDQCKTGTKFTLRLPMSRQDIADYLGVSIETVSRRLTYLKTCGVIELPNRNSVRVLDFEQLSALAGEC